MNISGIHQTFAARLDNLQRQLVANRLMFLGSILDLENELSEQAQAASPLLWKESVTIEEFSDEDGMLNDQTIQESTWLETLSRETGLDCRMVVDFKPVKALGIERWQVVVNEKGKPVTYDIRVWIVPSP